MPGEEGFVFSKTVTFGKPFKRTPKVIVSIAEFGRAQQGAGDTIWALSVRTRQVTTSSFYLDMQGANTLVNFLTASWIACE